jgi:hypothetical protein
MELGWLLGHLVYVRGLLPELFGALAEPQEGLFAAVPLDPLQTVLLELLSEEMENGSTRLQLMCAVSSRIPSLSLCMSLDCSRELTLGAVHLRMRDSSAGWLLKRHPKRPRDP